MIDLDELRHPLCFVRGIWWSMRHAAPISGHDFVELRDTPTEQVLVCSTCGFESVGKYGAGS